MFKYQEALVDGGYKPTKPKMFGGSQPIQAPGAAAAQAAPDPPGSVLAGVRELKHVHARANEVNMKTLKNWKYSNVSAIRKRLEEEEAERRRKEAEERAFWEAARRRAKENWRQLQERQRKEQERLGGRPSDRLPINTRVVAMHRGMEKLGVITKINPNGYYGVKFNNEGPNGLSYSIHESMIINAPEESEMIALGAAVEFDADDGKIYSGIVTSINADNTLDIIDNKGKLHSQIPLEKVQLLHNEVLTVPSRVNVDFRGSRPDFEGAAPGEVTAENPDGTYVVKFDKGKTVKRVKRGYISILRANDVVDDDQNQDQQEEANIEEQMQQVQIQTFDAGERVFVDYGNGESNGNGYTGRHKATILSVDTNTPTHTGSAPTTTYTVQFAEGGGVQPGVSGELLTVDDSPPEPQVEEEVDMQISVEAVEEPEQELVGTAEEEEKQEDEEQYPEYTKSQRVLVDYGDSRDDIKGVFKAKIMRKNPNNTYVVKFKRGEVIHPEVHPKYIRIDPAKVNKKTSPKPPPFVTKSPEKEERKQQKREEQEAEERHLMPVMKQSDPANRTLKGYDGASRNIKRLEEEEAARRAREAEEQRYWEERRRRALEKWAAIREAQHGQEFNIGDRVMVRDASNPDKELAMATIMSVRKPDGTYRIRRDDLPSNADVVEHEENMIMAANADFPLYQEVFVKASDGNYYAGTTVGLNQDGTVAVLYEPGEVHAVPLDYVAIPGEAAKFVSGDEVQLLVGGNANAPVYGVVVAVHDDGTVDVKFEDGVVERIAVEAIGAYRSKLGDNFIELVHGMRGEESEAEVATVQQLQAEPEPAPIKLNSSNKKKDELSATLAMMREGCTFTMYFSDHRRPMFLFYKDLDDGSEGAGHLHWHPPTDDPALKYQRIRGNSIGLRDISDIFRGKSKDHFISSEVAQADSKRSFTILDKNKEREALNFEAPDKSIRIKWLNGINNIITGAGKKLQVRFRKKGRALGKAALAFANKNNDDGSNGLDPLLNVPVAGHLQGRPSYGTLRPVKDGQTLNVKPIAYGSAGGPHNAAMPGRRQRVAATLSDYNEEDIQAMMQEGNLFSAYSIADQPIKETIFLFLEENSGRKKMGILYWCDGNKPERQFTEDNSLHLADVVGVDIGKQDDIFQLDIAKDAEWNKCMSILSKDGDRDLHLEGVTPKQLSQWLEGINSIKGQN